MLPGALSRSEQGFIAEGISAQPSQRSDGRASTDFRPIEVATGVAEEADGSARVRIGSTEVMCGVKAEVEPYAAPRVGVSDGNSSGAYRPWLPPTPRVRCTLEYSPALLEGMHSTDQTALQSALREMLAGCFAVNGSSVGPFDAAQFIVVPHTRFWLLHVDVLVLSQSGGNVLDAAFAAMFCALWDTKLPRTQALRLEAPPAGDLTTKDDPAGIKFLTRGRTPAQRQTEQQEAVDFTLSDEWKDGKRLQGHGEVPVCVCVYPLQNGFLLDATLEEEATLPVCVAVLASSGGHIYGVQQRGHGDMDLPTLKRATEVRTAHRTAPGGTLTGHQVGIYHARHLALALATQCG